MSGYRYLSSLEKFGINLGLERITCLLEQLKNPHEQFKSIHIAGTNGKGSTAAMAASILKEAGYKVGLYTSPHLFDYTERIKINGKDISRKDFAEGLRLIEKISSNPRLPPKADPPPEEKCGVANLSPTVFEVLTALAFRYFAQKKVDYAVVEVGLGGRLDATNVLIPEVSVITNIDLEHTEILGKTLAKISAEKAAIIKPGVPVVTAEHKQEALKVIKKIGKNNSSLSILVTRYPLSVTGKLLGAHQKLNAACAVAAIRLARIKVSRSAIKNGLRKTAWPGRFQIISKKPLIIVDGAHNPAGVKSLRVTIREQFPDKFTVIFGCQKTKDFKKMLREIKPVAARLIITQSSHLQAADLKFGAVRTNSIKEAIARWDGKSPLLVTGSLFLVADAMNLLSA